MDAETQVSYHYSPKHLQIVKNTLSQVIKKDTPRIVTAIDGYSSTGKGTVADFLVKELDYRQFSNGNTVRVFTWFFLSYFTDFDLEDRSFDDAIRHLSIKEVNEHGRDMLAVIYNKQLLGKLDILGDNPLNGLRSPKINEIVATISSRPSVVAQVRYRLKYRAKNSAERRVPFVAEGRDNYFIFQGWSHALLFYLMASDEKIAERAIMREEKRRRDSGKPSLTKVERDLVVTRTHQRNIDDAKQPLGYGKVLTPEEAAERSEYQVINTTELSEDAAIYAIVVRQLLHLGITPDFDTVATQPTESPTP